MPIEKMTEVPYPGVVPWLAVRKKINEIIEQGGGSSVTVDSELSSESENPVQNKVIYNALQNLPSGDGVTVIETDAGEYDDPINDATTITINGVTATKDEAWDAICKNGVGIMQTVVLRNTYNVWTPVRARPNETFEGYTDVMFMRLDQLQLSEIEGDKNWWYNVTWQGSSYYPSLSYDAPQHNFVRTVYGTVTAGSYSQDDEVMSVSVFGTSMFAWITVPQEIYDLIGNGISVDVSGSAVKLIATGSITIVSDAWPEIRFVFDFSGSNRDAVVLKNGVTKL